jgi:hypothetical protein
LPLQLLALFVLTFALMAADKSPSTPTHELISEAYKGDNDIFV